jgi:hypothetical protein
MGCRCRALGRSRDATSGGGWRSSSSSANAAAIAMRCAKSLPAQFRRALSRIRCSCLSRTKRMRCQWCSAARGKRFRASPCRSRVSGSAKSPLLARSFVCDPSSPSPAATATTVEGPTNDGTSRHPALVWLTPKMLVCLRPRKPLGQRRRYFAIASTGDGISERGDGFFAARRDAATRLRSVRTKGAGRRSSSSSSSCRNR